MTFESLINTKRTGCNKYTTVSLSKEINDKADIICKELQCSKMRFVELAMTKLVDEYNRKKSND